MSAKPIVVAYDISKRKTRYKVLRILKEWRLGGQKSVHECLLNIRQAEELFLQLSDPLDQITDNLMMVWLEPHRKVLCRGLGMSDITSMIRHVG